VEPKEEERALKIDSKEEGEKIGFCGAKVER
jgi:hypothetical protein